MHSYRCSEWRRPASHCRLSAEQQRPRGRTHLVRSWTIHYRADDGLVRPAYVVVPRWYGPRDDPPLPLIISTHGRGIPAIDNVRRYEDFAHLRRGRPGAYVRRSPVDEARRIAFSGVPLQIWWSRRDRVVSDQRAQSGALYRDVRRLNPAAPVVEFVGAWRHAAEMRARHAFRTRSACSD
jgi:hypothetical protein